jgi:hypothetical protein
MARGCPRSPLADVARRHETQRFGIEAQCLLPVACIHAGQFDLHRFSRIVAFADVASLLRLAFC